jgi:hypothetical protein
VLLSQEGLCWVVLILAHNWEDWHKPRMYEDIRLGPGLPIPFVTADCW